ncbi:MAG: prepilin-type N-terminal cleavage/methylation domain-containing protein [Desulfuromonadales bacterium]|nr:MAG: prepilin-type N-terminal cleavage/methylation domain-containing protein [Desulfuromonadales bacterium]
MCATWRNSPLRPATGTRGFTLLETLVALLLLAIVSAALYGSFFSVVRARERSAEGGEQRRELHGTLDLIRREVAGAIYRQGNTRLSFVVEDRDIFGKPASTLALTTIAPPAGEGSYPASDLLAVRYAMKERERSLYLTREATDPFSSVKPIPYPQMEEIEGFLVECYDGSSWVRSWNTELNPTLPRRVRITLTLREGETSAEFSTLAQPMVQP